jgi:hypothetical protein
VQKETISFSCEVFRDPRAKAISITPLVGGVPLTQLIANFEKAKEYDPAGSYAGIVPVLFRYGPLDEYFLGESEPDSYWGKMGGVYVLGCSCGEAGCWPLQCRIRVEGEEVIWSDFRQPHRPLRDYSEFGPFHFDGGQYRDAIDKLVANALIGGDTS